MATASPRTPATFADLVRLPADVRAEIVNGEVVEKAQPSGEHAGAQTGLAAILFGPFNRGSGGSKPGGWWIRTEVDVELEAHEVYRPDVAGWRRERCPSRPSGMPVTLLPDWVCEVLSTSNASQDLVKKLRVYHRCRVPHYWIVDPVNETLTVFRWTPDGYLTALTAGRADRVRAEPFEAIELPVGVLFGEDPD